MEVIGISGDEYIVKVSHKEIEKVFWKCHAYLPRHLKVGDQVDLALGYDFTEQISDICNSMHKTMQSFDRSKKILTDFCIMVSKIQKQEE